MLCGFKQGNSVPVGQAFTAQGSSGRSMESNELLGWEVRLESQSAELVIEGTRDVKICKAFRLCSVALFGFKVTYSAYTHD